MNKQKMLISLYSILATILTWYLNHSLGLGPFISSGLMGLIACLFLSKDLASIVYTSSFAGMSSLVVIPTILHAFFIGAVVGVLILNTTDTYTGIGGKGGTTVMVSVLLSIGILNLIF